MCKQYAILYIIAKIKSYVNTTVCNLVMDLRSSYIHTFLVKQKTGASKVMTFVIFGKGL